MVDRRLTIHLGEKMHRALKRHSDEWGISRSEILRRAYAHYNAEHAEAPPDVSKITKHESIMDENLWNRIEGNWPRTVHNIAKQHAEDGTPPAKFRLHMETNIQMAKELFGPVEQRFVKLLMEYYEENWDETFTTHIPDLKTLWRRSVESLDGEVNPRYMDRAEEIVEEMD